MFRASASIYPSNTKISKLTYTLKCKVPPKWSFDEYSPNAIDKHWRMWEKFSIILSLCRARAFSSNKLIESSAMSFFFSSAMEGFLGMGERFYSRETSSRPKFLYLDFVRDMCWKMIKSSLLWYHWSGLFSEWNERREITMKYSWKFPETEKYNNTWFLLMK